VITAIGNTGQGNYDVNGWDCPYHSVGTAMGVGKLMGAESGSARQCRVAGYGAAHAHVCVLHWRPHDVEGHARCGLLGLDLMAGLKKIDLASIDLAQAKQFGRAAVTAIQNGTLGYTLLTAIKPC
jgi:hypothetical protein